MLSNKILVVDDEPRMCDSIKLLLDNSDLEVQTSNNGHEAIKYLEEGSFDLLFLDLIMPDMDGFQVMDYINRRHLDTMVIVLTGHVSLESALKALRKGAYDYIIKPFEPEELLTKAKNALDQKRLRHEVQYISGKLELSEGRYRYLVQNSPDIIYILDEKGNFTFINDAVEHLTGFKVEQLIGKPYTTVVYEKDLEKAKWLFNERRTGGRASHGVELRIKACNSNVRFGHSGLNYLIMELKSTGIYDRAATEEGKRYLGAYGILRDITDRKRLEAQLEYAQRMESLGTLSGGIAHDFNNLLMAIQGNVSLMLLDVDSSHPHYQRLKNIEEYIQKGANLTRQLLGFARGGKYEVRATDLNKVIKKQNRMFGSTQKQINIHGKYEERLWTVEVDQRQMEQVLLNLYINASQAMPKGGDLYIQTENFKIDEDCIVDCYRMQAGRYIKISITDTGIGMSEAIQQRIFDPFFTTRAGRGTGLGLASVYGIIKNHGGFITVKSREGVGSTFTIYLPASERERIETEETHQDRKNCRTVLLIDDEDMIIEVGREVLKMLDYEVLVAKGGKEGIEIYRQNRDRIDIILLDMIMPDMGGIETYQKIREIDPDAKFLLSSGYSIDKEASKILKDGQNGFIQKPFNINQLSEKIREILEPESA